MRKCSECRWYNGKKCELKNLSISMSANACSYLCSREYFTKKCSCCRWYNGKKCELKNLSVSMSNSCSNFARY